MNTGQETSRLRRMDPGRRTRRGGEQRRPELDGVRRRGREDDPAPRERRDEPMDRATPPGPSPDDSFGSRPRLEGPRPGGELDGHTALLGDPYGTAPH